MDDKLFVVVLLFVVVCCCYTGFGHSPPYPVSGGS